MPGEDDKGGLKDEFGDEYGSLDAEDPYGPPDENDGYDIDEFLSQKEEEEDTDAPEEKIDRPPKAADVDPLAK